MILRKGFLFILSILFVSNIWGEETSEKESFDRSGYILRPEVGVGVSTFYDEGAPYISIDFGRQFNNLFFAGVGVEYTIVQSNSISRPDRDKFYSTLPIYASARLTPVRRPITPIMDLKIGYNIGIGSHDFSYYEFYKNENSLWSFKERTSQEKWQGLFLYASAGIQIHNFDLLWFWDFTGGKTTTNYYNYYNSTSNTTFSEKEYDLHYGLGLKIGYNFNLSKKK